jgi:hypothetical protein
MLNLPLESLYLFKKTASKSFRFKDLSVHRDRQREAALFYEVVKDHFDSFVQTDVLWTVVHTFFNTERSVLVLQNFK